MASGWCVNRISFMLMKDAQKRHARRSRMSFLISVTRLWFQSHTGFAILIRLYWSNVDLFVCVCECLCVCVCACVCVCVCRGGRLILTLSGAEGPGHQWTAGTCEGRASFCFRVSSYSYRSTC